MSCCCQRIYRMCAVQICDGQPLSIPVPVTIAGAYELELDFLGSVVIVQNEQVVGPTMLFDKDQLNESFTYVGKLVDPDGSAMSFTIGGQTYDCLEFTTKRRINEPASES